LYYLRCLLSISLPLFYCTSLFFFNATPTTEIYTLSLHDGSSDLEFFAEIRVFAQPGVGDVGIGNFQLVEGDAEPAVVLRILPVVDDAHARSRDGVRSNVERGVGRVDVEPKSRGGFFELRAVDVAK